MGDVNHRCANNTEKHVHSTIREEGREREDEQGKREGCCCCCLFFSIYRECGTRTHIHIRAYSKQCLYISHFCLFFLLFFSSSLFFAVIYALSPLPGIHRQWVMTRKVRGEDVYECMFGQTLNDERTQNSNLINCTKRKHRELQK